MAALSIRNIDDEVVDRLRVRAAQNGRSMEAEAREILANAVDVDAEEGLFGALLDRFGSANGVDLDIPRRDEKPRAADVG